MKATEDAGTFDECRAGENEFSWFSLLLYYLFKLKICAMLLVNICPVKAIHPLDHQPK